jgi:hypothetical protein
LNLSQYFNRHVLVAEFVLLTVFAVPLMAAIDPQPTVSGTVTPVTNATGDQAQITLSENQKQIVSNQGTLAQNQTRINDNMKEWLSGAITANQMESLLLDENVTEKGYDNLVNQLKFVFSHTSDIQASAFVNQAVSVFESAAQSNVVSQAKSEQMSNFVSLILSGAGNQTASDSLWVSDVLPNVTDPSDAAISTYNSIIYPYVQLSANSSSYELKECSASVEDDTGVPKLMCDLMKSALYAQALSGSCSSSYVAPQSSSSAAQSNASTASQSSAASTTQATGPTYSKSIYPSGFSGGCSGQYYQTADSSWNGWNATMFSIFDAKKYCSQFSAQTVPATYQSMTANIITACSDLSTAIDNIFATQGITQPSSPVDASAWAQDLMSDTITPLADITKYSRRLMVRMIFDNAMKDAVKQNPSMAYYGSLYTLVGPDSYHTQATTTSTTADGITSTPIDLTPALSSQCIDLIRSGQYSVSVDTDNNGTERSKLAALLIQQIASMYPIRTVLPIVSIPKPDGALAVVAINGQFVAIDASGNVMTTGSSSGTAPQVEQDASSISSAQSTVMSSMVTANRVFQGQMDTFLKGKTAAITPLIDAYADRYLKITVRGTDGSSGTVCSLTPAQLNQYAATWRLNPNVTFVDAGAASGGSSSTATDPYSWANHLATSSAAEVSKEIATLEAQNNYMTFVQYQQAEKLGLMGTLVPLTQSAAQTSALSVQSVMLDKLVDDYVKGIKSTSASSSSAMTG